jgi:hypothetical protein
MKSFDLPVNFLSYLESGSIKITCDNSPMINFRVEGNYKIIDVEDIPISVSKMPGLFKQLSVAKGLAKSLKQDNITLEVRLHGETVLKLGADANPKLVKIVTLSDSIEITNLKLLKKLGGLI